MFKVQLQIHLPVLANMACNLMMLEPNASQSALIIPLQVQAEVANAIAGTLLPLLMEDLLAHQVHVHLTVVLLVIIAFRLHLVQLVKVSDLYFM